MSYEGNIFTQYQSETGPDGNRWVTEFEGQHPGSEFWTTTSPSISATLLHDIIESQPGASRRLRLDTSAFGRKWYNQSRWLPKLQLIKRPPAARLHPAKNQQLNVTPCHNLRSHILAIVRELFRASIGHASSSYPTWGSSMIHLLDEVLQAWPMTAVARYTQRWGISDRKGRNGINAYIKCSFFGMS